jgi:phosphoribosylanthranilate isomerase
MTKRMIKICGIRDPQTAIQAAQAGADFIGIIFHPQSPRYVEIEQALLIANATKSAGSLPVAVFVNHTDAEMLRICEATDIKTVQLHGETARAHHHLLPDEYRRIYVQNVLDNGKLLVDAGLRYLDSKRDLILIDHVDPGHGKPINRSAFSYDLPFPWLLAGGLTPSNVAATINDLHPDGVDVSSGVESFRGNKDIFLIQTFIRSARGHLHE